jgi:hypothetical protein
MEKSKVAETEKGEPGKEQIKNMLIILFDIKGVVDKNSSWQAKQSSPHTTVKFYDDCVIMCKDFAWNFVDERTGCCIMTTYCLTLPFHQGIFDQKHDCRLHSLNFFCFSY